MDTLRLIVSLFLMGSAEDMHDLLTVDPMHYAVHQTPSIWITKNRPAVSTLPRDDM